VSLGHPQQVPGDQKSGNDKKYVYANKTASRPSKQVKRDYREDRDHPQALNIEALSREFGSPPTAPRLLPKLCKTRHLPPRNYFPANASYSSSTSIFSKIAAIVRLLRRFFWHISDLRPPFLIESRRGAFFGLSEP
jgi:hypothetical protein